MTTTDKIMALFDEFTATACNFYLTGAVCAETRAEGHKQRVALRAEIEALVRDAEKLRHNNEVLANAIWKACGDDEETVNATIESQGELK